ncbi:1,2-diacylglycerol 3-glucosyltransferase [Bacillus sp. BRMEA1]|uniref:MGDG synthase family glycosyltransferase n=1 Tax=Neobacillus endophyticus TaxID=2738405 RepID=UPI001563FAC6|nr:glycosyltransferase [Neobacillus endophyticus]NRD79297.1 1,2-diacylglycerol 3-glucosyltransferase [Neobacillus endophyticus]
MKMNEKDKILILSAGFGDGHKQVANAIGEAVELSLPNVEPINLDIMEWLHPHLYPLSTFVYKRVIKNFPQFYSYLYKRTRERNPLSIKLHTLFTLGMGSMLEIIREINPTAVVSTYPFAAGIMSKLKEQGLIDIPIVTVITDFTDHSYWLHPYTDQYIVGSEEVMQRLISLGIDSEKINYTGIPVRPKFTTSQPRELLARKYDLDPNQFTILIMGGGDGFIGKGVSTFQSLEQLPSGTQFIIICGRNKKLRKQLEEELKGTKHTFRIMGYCENVQELMAVSDLMISKPGGVTTSEAMAMELPLFIYRPLPGQEEDNARYLVKLGLAILVENEHDLVCKIGMALSDEQILKSMKQRSRIYQNKTSAIEALNVVVRSINRMKKERSYSYDRIQVNEVDLPAYLPLTAEHSYRN